MHQRSLFHDDIHWEHEAHGLSIHWIDFTPQLICSFSNEIQIHTFHFSESVEMEVSNEKSCVGSWTGSNFQPCPTSTRVSRFQRCDACAGEVIPDQRCIFEPRCQGDPCQVDGHLGESVDFCSRPHSVYLAFYGKHVKIGMTSKERVRQRCIEQGADAFVTIKSTGNRLDARHLEKELSRKYSLRQSFNNTEILRMTGSSIKKSEIERTHQKLLTECDSDEIDFYDTLQFLEGYPITLPLRSIPRETSTPGLHIGKILGIKGRFLYYDSNGLRALNLTDIPSRKIHFNAVSFE